MSTCVLIILVFCSWVTFGGFSSKFSKCCFRSCIHSCWLVAFILAFAVLLLLNSFTVRHVILDFLSSTESPILSIWFCMYSFCSFRLMLVNSFCAFLRFRILVLVGFFLLHLETILTSVRFFITTNVCYETLGLALCVVCMHSVAASNWALTKFSYSTFRVCVSVFSYSTSNLFLNVNAYLSQISLLLTSDQLWCTVVVVRVVFLRRLSRIFAAIIWWSEDIPTKEEYASQINALWFHFLFIKT